MSWTTTTVTSKWWSKEWVWDLKWGLIVLVKVVFRMVCPQDPLIIFVLRHSGDIWSRRRHVDWSMIRETQTWTQHQQKSRCLSTRDHSSKVPVRVDGTGPFIFLSLESVPGLTIENPYWRSSPKYRILEDIRPPTTGLLFSIKVFFI